MIQVSNVRNSYRGASTLPLLVATWFKFGSKMNEKRSVFGMWKRGYAEVMVMLGSSDGTQDNVNIRSCRLL